MSPRVVEALVGSVKREMGVDLRNSYAEGSFEFQILEELAPRKGEEVIRKTTYGAFNSTDLEERLRRQGITSLVITGVTTSACVETTARDAADRGFGVVLVDEGTCDWDQEYHLASLRAFRRLFGDVAKSAEDVIEALEEGKAVPRS
jgi:nicotinamidase-related amidase